MLRKVALAVIITTIALPAWATGDETACIRYDTTITRTGVVIVRSNVSEGPEGDWGKKTVSFPMLILNRPLCTVGTGEDDAQGLVWAMQLGDICERQWPSTPTPVRVTGTLIAPQTWHWHTSVGFVAKKVEGSKLPACAK
jgi:hypothetical protein